MACTNTCVHPTPTQAHCGAAGCHLTFGGVWGFDKHRVGGGCRHPSTMGMIIDAGGVWRSPPTEADRVRLAARRAR